MSIIVILHEDLKAALRSGDTFRRDALRFLVSAAKNVALEKRKPVLELSDEEMISLLRRGVKQREESALQYRSGGRAELAEKEDRERELISTYLPASPSESVIHEGVVKIIAETNASSSKDRGKVMGLAMKSIPNAPGAEVRRMVEKLLP